MRIRFAVLFAGLVAVGLAQVPESFEVASVRVNSSASNSNSMTWDDGYCVATNVTTLSLILTAFHRASFQIDGMPGWAMSEHFDVRGKIPGAGAVSDERLGGMLESLLVERFHLEYHHKTLQRPIYVLTVAKSGLKAKKADPGEPPTEDDAIGYRSAETSRHASPIAEFAEMLQGNLGRKVRDETGLTDRYDLHLLWSPNPLPDTQLPSLPTALQDQLGLKLESRTGPVDLIVIDRLERPSEN